MQQDCMLWQCTFAAPSFPQPHRLVRQITRPRSGPSVQVEIANGLTGIRRFFRLLDRFLKFLLPNIGGVLLGLDGLAEDRFTTVILLFHGASSFFDVLKHLGLNRRGMGDYRPRADINLQHGVTAGTGHFEGWSTLCHCCASYRKSGLLCGVRGLRWL